MKLELDSVELFDAVFEEVERLEKCAEFLRKFEEKEKLPKGEPAEVLFGRVVRVPYRVVRVPYPTFAEFFEVLSDGGKQHSLGGIESGYAVWRSMEGTGLLAELRRLRAAGWLVARLDIGAIDTFPEPVRQDYWELLGAIRSDE